MVHSHLLFSPSPVAWGRLPQFLQETRFADCCETGAALQQHVILAEMLVRFCASKVCNSMHQGD